MIVLKKRTHILEVIRIFILYDFLKSSSGFCRKEPENNENENWYQLANRDPDQSFTCVPCESYFSQICCSENEVIQLIVRFDLNETSLQNFFQYLVENCVGPPVNNYYPTYREGDEDLETYEDDFECPDGEPNCRNCAISYFCALNTGF